MRTNTGELGGAALDWAVAKCVNAEWWDDFDDMDAPGGLRMDDGETYSPSTDWGIGGPIVDLNISDLFRRGDQWTAYIRVPDSEPFQESGPTLLIAAMRCYVASKLGDEVDVPDALLST